jgi:hypothetical protein
MNKWTDVTKLTIAARTNYEKLLQMPLEDPPNQQGSLEQQRRIQMPPEDPPNQQGSPEQQ